MFKHLVALFRSASVSGLLGLYPFVFVILSAYFLVETRGHWLQDAVLVPRLFVVALGALLVSLLFCRLESLPCAPCVLAGALLFFSWKGKTMLNFFMPSRTPANSGELPWRLLDGLQRLGMLGALALLMVTVLLVVMGPGRVRIPWLALVVMGSIPVVMDVILLQADPSPTIDVFTSNTEAVKYLLQGLNPFAQAYQDIYAGRYAYHAGFAYWPGVLLWQTAAYAALGDIRYGFILAKLITVASVWLWARNIGSAKPLETSLLLLLFLFFPVGLFVLDQAWVDTLLIMAVAVTLCATGFGWFGVAGMVLGFLVSVKQYGVVFAVPFVAYVLLVHGRTAVTRVVAVSAVVFAVIVGPFAVWDWDGFIQMTITNTLGQPARTDALTLTAWILRSHGSVPPGLMVGLTLGVVALASWGMWRSLAVPLTTAAGWSVLLRVVSVWHAAVFLFGQQAFCNYYYYLVFFLVLLVVTAGREPALIGARSVPPLSPQPAG